MTPERAKKLRRWAAIAGAILAIACSSLPEDYRAACRVIASACTGGL